MSLSRFVVGAVSVSVIVLGAGVVSGQDYPSKPIRIVTAGLGGGGDFTARLVAQGISGPLGQPVIVDNRPTGPAAPETVAKAPPDGYTLLVASTSFLTATLLEKMPYDPVRDFAPITQVEGSPSVLVVHPSLPVKSIKELIALAKAKPGELNYGATAIGSSQHLATELFKSMAGVNIVRINYKSSGASITSLIAGETQMVFASGPAATQHVKSGRLRALAITSAQPSALLPGLPTVAASGVPGYESVGMTAIFVPAKTAETIIKRLNQEIVRFLKTAEAKEKFLNAGMDSETALGSPEQLAATVKGELAKWGKVIKDAGIKLE